MTTVRSFRRRPTRLEPDQGCANRHHWRCRLPLTVAPEGLDTALERRGWSARCRQAVLRLWRHEAGHELVWVPPTGRVQIRVDLDVPVRSRPRVARDIHRLLTAALREGGA